MPEIKYNVLWSHSSFVTHTTSVPTSATFTDQYLQDPTSTSPMAVGESTYAALISVSKNSNSRSYRNAQARTLFSLSIDVPANTRYNVPIKAQTYSRCGNEGTCRIGSYIYSMGTDPKAVPGTYYTMSNSPSQYKFAGSHKTVNKTNATVSDTQQRIFHFDNPTGSTKTVTQYFYAGICSLGFNCYRIYGTVAYARLTVTEAPTIQRLVPTSYDVEYDQLRHSLEEEYYEAIRLDENYPTRQIPCVSFQCSARYENLLRIKFIIKPTEVGKWGLNTAENTGRDGSPVGSASPLADTENGDVSAVNLNVYWTSTAVSTSATFTDHHLQPPISTNSLIVGESTNAALMSVSRSSSGGFSNAATRTLFSLSMEVPAYTRYSVPLKVETYSRGYEGPSGSQIGSYVYSMGTDPDNVPGTYYTVGNNPSKYKIAGSHISNWVGKSSVSDSKQNTFYFQNLTGKTQTVTYYFYAGVCSIKFNRWMCYGTIGYARLTVTETPTMQRLVPTSYDVEYDQLRHSLEEEYYEAIRLDENYPTRQIPCVSFQCSARYENLLRIKFIIQPTEVGK